MRVKNISATDPAKPEGENQVMEYQYEYDNMDNIVSKATEHGAYGYGYDNLYRLTAADNPDSTGIADEAFSYDGVGNRLTSADTTGQWSYNANNELTGQDNVTYEYDANGNMVKKTTGATVTSYVYNLEDRLYQVWSGEVETGDLIAEYYYDPFGRRLWKQVGGTRTYYHYSDEGLIAEFDGSGAEIKTYGYKPGSLWTTDPLFMKIGSQYYFYHNDHLGTPQKMTDVSGATVWSVKYESFGKATVDAASSVENNLRFPGQYYDAETGLHYNWFRYYEPGTGRYFRVDPIGFWGGVNFYIYCLNNPLILVDPDGLIVFYGGGGVAAGGGYKPDNNFFASASAYRYFGTTKEGYQKGLALTTTEGKMLGGTLGTGFTLGVHFGDVEDFKGKSKVLGLQWAGITVEYTLDPKTKALWGISFSFGGKGLGYGGYFGDSTTRVLPTITWPGRPKHGCE